MEKRKLREMSDTKWTALTAGVPRVELTPEQAKIARESELRVLSGVDLPTTAEFLPWRRAKVD